MPYMVNFFRNILKVSSIYATIKDAKTTADAG